MTKGFLNQDFDVPNDLTVGNDVTITGNADAAQMQVNNTGLRVADTDDSHYLVIAPGSNLTADRTFTLTTGDAASALSVEGSASAINQDLTSDATPTFVGINLGDEDLDDYDEGTFTPTLTGSGAGPDTITYTRNDGYYTRIGNLVRINLRITISTFTLGSGSGRALIQGLPFTSQSITQNQELSQYTSGVNFDATAEYVVSEVENNSSQISMTEVQSNASATSTDISDFAAGDDFVISGTYLIP